MSTCVHLGGSASKFTAAELLLLVLEPVLLPDVLVSSHVRLVERHLLMGLDVDVSQHVSSSISGVFAVNGELQLLL